MVREMTELLWAELGKQPRVLVLRGPELEKVRPKPWLPRVEDGRLQEGRAVDLGSARVWGRRSGLRVGGI